MPLHFLLSLHHGRIWIDAKSAGSPDTPPLPHNTPRAEQVRLYVELIEAAHIPGGIDAMKGYGRYWRTWGLIDLYSFKHACRISCMHENMQA